MIYVSSPYSHHDAAIRHLRFEQVMWFVAVMAKQGYYLFSPIIHWHPVSVNHDLPAEFDWWMAYDLEMLSRCDELWVLVLDGWLESRGVTKEIAFAAEREMPITYYSETGNKVAP